MVNSQEMIQAYRQIAARLNISYQELMDFLDDITFVEVVALHSALSTQLYNVRDQADERRP